MKLLGIETSSHLGSVAIAIDGDVSSREMASPREQTAQLLELVDHALHGAGIELGELAGIAFGRGPGSFTGIRVAAAVAQGLALASGVPLLPVSSLQCLAQTAFRLEGIERSLVCVDARMGELYFAEFEIVDGVARALGDERLGRPADLAAPLATGWAALGDGFAAHRDALTGLTQLARRTLAELKPSAEDLFPKALLDLAAGAAVAPADALPVYLRDQTAWRRKP